VPIAETESEDQRMIRETIIPELKYTYMSMIIAKTNDHDAIKKKF